jgi:transposase
MEISQRRQVFDIPEPKLMVREFQQLSCTCPACGQVNTGTFPEAVKAPVQYGNGVKTLVTLLNVKCQLSLKNISGLFSDLFGQPINEATLIGAIKTSYSKLTPVADAIKTKLQSGAVLHADETGVQVAGERNWAHTISSEDYTYLYVDSSRGKKAIEANFEGLFTYNGLLVHDCFGSYWGMENAKHVLCNAHILRELTACKEQGRTWAAQMHDLLMLLYDTHKKEILLTPTHEAWKAYDQITQLALQEEPEPEVKPKKRGRQKRTKGRNLAERLIKYKTEILRFALEKGVPFTNNLAERDLRPVKGKQKVAGCFRTWEGAKHYARLQSVFSTWRKLQRSAFLELRQILDGSSFDWNLKTT